jgi:membrane protein
MIKTFRNIGSKINRTVTYLEKDIWRIPLDSISGRQAYFIRQLRILSLALRGFFDDEIIMRASALTYFTMLSIVPFAALGFGIAKGFGLEAYLDMQLELAFAGREEVYEWIMSFAQSILQTASGGMIAGVGLIILFYTIMRLLSYMEESFNEIWRIKKSRSWSRKFSDYFSIMFITPLFFILSSGFTVFLSTHVVGITENITLLGFLSGPLVFIINLIPYVLIWIMLTLLYMIMPNTNVKFSSALMAGIVAGTLFQLVQWGYIYMQIGVSRYNAIYGSFAALPLLLMWVQVSWLMILFGAEISYASQNVDNYEFDVETKNLSPYNKKILSLYIMHLLVNNFKKGEPPVNPHTIAYQLVIPNKLVNSILDELVRARLVTETRTTKRDVAFQPAMDINLMTIRMVMDRLDQIGDDVLLAKPTAQLFQITRSVEAFGKCIEQSEQNLLLKDINSN